jgi:hypothetical protein
MKTRTRLRWVIGPAVVCALALGTSSKALAHCDGLDGPVVKAAQTALDTRNVALVLVWVQSTDESEIRAAFEHTLAVRALSPQAKELADRYFFETLVRVHRAGEGAPYTGLKPAGRDLGPAIPAADKAIEDGSIEPVGKLLTEAMHTTLLEHFRAVLSAKAFEANDVVAGREYVTAYVEFIHYVERLHEAITTSAHGHFGETESSKDGGVEPDRHSARDDASAGTAITKAALVYPSSSMR